MLPISQWLKLPAELFFRREDERIYAIIRIAFGAVVLATAYFGWVDWTG